MTRNRLVPGCEFIDNMRKQLTRLEMELMEPAPDHNTVSLALVSLENNRAYFEGAIYEHLSGPTIDIQQL
jgi:hypothetical protein